MTVGEAVRIGLSLPVPVVALLLFALAFAAVEWWSHRQLERHQAAIASSVAGYEARYADLAARLERLELARGASAPGKRAGHGAGTAELLGTLLRLGEALGSIHSGTPRKGEQS